MYNSNECSLFIHRVNTFMSGLRLDYYNIINDNSALNIMNTKSLVYFAMSIILIFISPRFLVIGIPDANVIDFFLAFFVVFFSYLFLSLGISDTVK